jgi:hypothetical protein
MEMTMAGTRLSVVAIALTLGMNAAAAGEPVAIVETLDAEGTGLQLMDYVEEGRVIDLGSGGTITLGYLASCRQEQIRGGHVVVGREQSTVENGEVRRERVGCDGGAIMLSASEADKSGVMVFRRPPRRRLILYGASPVVLLSGAGGSVTIERLDKPGARLTLSVEGRFVDLAGSDTALVPGGIYRATVGDAVLEFQIDSLAAPGPSPLVGRLLRF